MTEDDEETLEDIERKIRELESRTGQVPSNPTTAHNPYYGANTQDILSTFNPAGDPLLSQAERIMKIGMAKEAIKSQSVKAQPPPPPDPDEVKHRRRLESLQAEMDLRREQRAMDNQAFQEDMKKMEMARMQRQDEFQQTMAKIAEERANREEEWRRRREEKDDKYLKLITKQRSDEYESPKEKMLIEELQRLKQEREKEKEEQRQRRRDAAMLKKFKEMRDEFSDMVEDMGSGGGTMDDYLQKKLELEEYEKKLESAGIRFRKGGLSQLAEGETGPVKYIGIGLDSAEDFLERPVVKRWGDRIFGPTDSEEELDDEDIEDEVEYRKKLKKLDEKKRAIHRKRRELISLGVNPDQLVTATDLMIDNFCEENNINGPAREQIYIARTTLRDGKTFPKPLDDDGKPLTSMTNEYLALGLNDIDDDLEEEEEVLVEEIELEEDLEELLEEEEEEELFAEEEIEIEEEEIDEIEEELDEEEPGVE